MNQAGMLFFNCFKAVFLIEVAVEKYFEGNEQGQTGCPY